MREVVRLVCHGLRATGKGLWPEKQLALYYASYDLSSLLIHAHLLEGRQEAALARSKSLWSSSALGVVIEHCQAWSASLRAASATGRSVGLPKQLAFTYECNDISSLLIYAHLLEGHQEAAPACVLRVYKFDGSAMGCGYCRCLQPQWQLALNYWSSGSPQLGV